MERGNGLALNDEERELRVGLMARCVGALDEEGDCDWSGTGGLDCGAGVFAQDGCAADCAGGVWRDWRDLADDPV